MYARDVEKAAFSACIQDVSAVLGYTDETDDVGRRSLSGDEAGVEKLDYQIFSLCIEKAEVLPEDCVFIGDSLRHDIEGVKQAGMQVIWYHKEELSEEEQQKAVQENIPVMRQFSQCIELLRPHVQRGRGKKRCLED